MNPVKLIRKIKLIFLCNQAIAFTIISIALLFQWYSQKQYVARLTTVLSFSFSLLISYSLFTIKYKDRDFSKIKDRVNLNYSVFGLQLAYATCFAFDCGIILEIFNVLTPENTQICLLAYGVIVEPLLFGYVVPDLFDYASRIMKKVPKL